MGAAENHSPINSKGKAISCALEAELRDAAEQRGPNQHFACQRGRRDQSNFSSWFRCLFVFSFFFLQRFLLCLWLGNQYLFATNKYSGLLNDDVFQDETN